MVILVKLKKYRIYKILAFCLIIFFLFSPLGASIRSYAIMFPYSHLHHRESVLYKNNIKLTIPGGIKTRKPDWYPFVIAFNDSEGLSKYLGEEVEFTILYNFGHFPLLQGASTYYNPDSPYYSSFYGGYVVKPEDKDRRFGFFDTGEINLDELAKAPQYDQTHLVLPTLGCPLDQRVFEEKISDIEYNVEYVGYDDWVRVDSDIKTNSPAHESKGFQQGYLQFGKPMGNLDYSEDFPIIDLKGRVYVRYFKEFQATIVLYIMAPSWKTVNECDIDILSKTRFDSVHHHHIN